MLLRLRDNFQKRDKILGGLLPVLHQAKKYAFCSKIYLTQKGPQSNQDLNQGPACCDVAAVFTAQKL